MSVQVKSLPSCYYVIKNDRHSIKQELLSAIDSCEFEQETTDSGTKISKTDYFIDNNQNNSYINILFQHIHNDIIEFLAKARCVEIGIESIWFQQYNHGDTHGWHTHHTTNFAGVHFVEIPSSECVTELYDPYTNGIIRPDNVNEGDTIIFPSSFLHRSPKNKTLERKTIIAFNCSVFVYNGGINSE